MARYKTGRQIREGFLKKRLARSIGAFMMGAPDWFQTKPDGTQLEQWRAFYAEVFRWPGGRKLDAVALPERTDDLAHLVFIPQDLSLNKALEIIERHMSIRNLIGPDLDDLVRDSDRKPDSTYAIRVRDEEDSDEAHQRVSTADIREKGILGITLLERLILEMFYFWKTKGREVFAKRHLDAKTITLCSGSRCADGSVPTVRFCAQEEVLIIGSCSADNLGDNLRIREVTVAK